MEIPFKEHVSLKPFNTFGIDVLARYFVEFDSVEALSKIVTSEIYKTNDVLVVGGGSNILLRSDFKGLVLLNRLKGISKIKERTNEVVLKVASGEVWHDLVLHAIKHNWGGIENMSLIPGSVGAAPMQNIGAYGKELKDVFVSLEAFNLESQEVEVFDKVACEFGYRESVFKRKLKNKYIILSINISLSTANHTLNTSYGAIENQLLADNITNPGIAEVSNAVIKIRQSKLPDPAQIGNAGSFFKNPVVPTSEFQTLIQKFPDIPNYPAENGKKLAAGWLIEQSGWKGKTFGNYGVHKNQALVLVNYGGAEGQEIYNLSQDILDDVKKKFGVQLEREVNMV